MNLKFDSKIFLIVVILVISVSASAQVVERFPKPDFQSGYERPEIHLTDARSQIF